MMHVYVCMLHWLVLYDGNAFVDGKANALDSFEWLNAVRKIRLCGWGEQEKHNFHEYAQLVDAETHKTYLLPRTSLHLTISTHTYILQYTTYTSWVHKMNQPSIENRRP